MVSIIPKRPVFQPLIAGLFCLLLISLFLASALLDVRRTQNMLLEIFENKGLTIKENVEMMAQDKLKGLMGITNQTVVSFQDMESIEIGFRMQEAILSRLIEYGREADRRAEKGRLTREELQALASEAGVQAMVQYGPGGEVVLESAPVPKELIPWLAFLLEEDHEIVFDFHTERAGKAPPYLVGVRRKNSEGMIVLVLNQEGLQYWSARVVLQEAVEEGGWRKGIRYFMVEDSRGRLLAGAGNPPGVESGNRRPSDVASIRKDGGQPSRWIIEGPPEILEVQAPMQLNDGMTATARIGVEIEEARRLREREEARIFFSAGIMTMISVLGMFLFYGIQGRHHQRLRDMRERLHQAERLSSLGRLAAGLAHEIRNPLNAVSMAVQRIHREFAPVEPESRNEFSHLITVVREEIRRLNRIIEDFVGPARLRPTEFRPERLVDLLDQVARLAREEAGSRDIRIECQWEDPDLVIQMDSARMHQAMLNLVKNAMESIPGGGTITMAARPLGPHHVMTTIRDTGVGIPAERLERMLEFEYTTKEKGLGLGLPISEEIIQAHGGEMRIESEPGKGTTVTIILPRRKT